MQPDQGQKQPTLLVTTVGGTPNAVVAGILRVRADRILFVCSPETRDSIEKPDANSNRPILDMLRDHGHEVPAGAYRIVDIPDAQDLETFVQIARQVIEPEVREWVRHSGQHRVVVDFTGGTKCMSAGIVLASLDWPCCWQYVGGTERTKGGVGVVVDGKERIVHPHNPWDTLAWRHVLRAAALFDEGQTGGAVAVLESAVRQAQPGEVKTGLAALSNFCTAYSQWDAFRHADAAKCLTDYLKNPRAVGCFAAPDRVMELQRRAVSDRGLLEQLAGQAGISRLLIADIYANGQRRVRERRFDDAAARFYRCVEALAQEALVRYGIESTASVPVSRIPEPLRRQWQIPDGVETVELPLGRSYQLLAELGDGLGLRFQQSMLADPRRTPLQFRNHSILAHGFQPITEAAVKSLVNELKALAGSELGAGIPEFPRLGELLGTL